MSAVPDVEPVEMLPGVLRRTLQTGEQVQLVHFTLRPGGVVPRHSHPHEQAGTILEGHLRVEIDGRTLDLGPGDSYLIPGGVSHLAVAQDEVALIDVFSPPRDEYR